MSNSELFAFDHGVAQSLGMEHWDALWAGLIWIGAPKVGPVDLDICPEEEDFDSELCWAYQD